MNELPRCPKCDCQLPSDAPAGLCPQCLVKAGFESQPRSRGKLEPTQRNPARSGFEPPWIEELVGRFPQLEILELIGKGGMGAVYKARQRSLDRLVAVKILPPEISDDPAFAERFQREARALARLSHPHIVAVYDFGVVGQAFQPDAFARSSQAGKPDLRDGLCYIIMEFVDGANLRQAIRTGTLTSAEALAIVPQICEALQFAHDEGIVHRDIKPENILIDKRGRVKIADFGLAKLLGQDASDHPLTATHQVMGTLRYMAPEQMQGSREVDHRADIYSLGVVFYELLTGELPMGKFAPPSKRAQVDVRLDEIVLRALEQEPEQRYQHASEVKTDVDAISRDSQPPNLNAQKPAHQEGRTTHAEPMSLPFTIAECVHWGLFGEVHGKLRPGKNEIVLEFEVRSLFPVFRSGLKEVNIPFDDIESVEWDGWDLTLRTKTMKALAEVPKSSLGQVVFDFSMTDFDVPGGISKPMEHFLAYLPSRLVGQSARVSRPVSAKGMVMPSQPDPTHFADTGRSSWPTVSPQIRRQLKGPAIALMLYGLLVFFPATLCFTNGFDIADGNDASPATTGYGLIALSFLLLGLAGLLLRGGWHMLSLENYRAGLLASLLGQPFGLWGLIVLSRPDVKSAFGLAWSQRPSNVRPKLVLVLAAFNLVGAIVLMLVCAMEEPAEFARSVPRLWQVWETVDAVLGFSMATGMFAASIGLFLWKPWARKLTLGVCVFGLASIVFDAPYLARFLLPDLYAEIQATVVVEGGDPYQQDFVTLVVFTLFGGLVVLALTCLIGQLVYFTRPRVVVAFESQGEKYGRFITWLFTGTGAVVGVASVFGPLALVLGIIALFNGLGGDQAIPLVPAFLPPFGTITSGIGAEFTVPAGQVAVFEVVTRRENETVPVPPHCGYVMAPPDTPIAGTFRWSRKSEGDVFVDRGQEWSLEILTAGGGRGYSETILLPDELNAIVGASGLALGLLESNVESIHWGTADANDLPANGLIGLRVTVVPHGLNAGGSGNGHIDWKESQTRQSTSRREIPTDAP